MNFILKWSDERTSGGIVGRYSILLRETRSVCRVASQIDWGRRRRRLRERSRKCNERHSCVFPELSSTLAASGDSVCCSRITGPLCAKASKSKRGEWWRLDSAAGRRIRSESSASGSAVGRRHVGRLSKLLPARESVWSASEENSEGSWSSALSERSSTRRWSINELRGSPMSLVRTISPLSPRWESIAWPCSACLIRYQKRGK